MDGKRKLAAIVFSDIVDCTKIMSKDEKLGFEYIKKHSSMIKDSVTNYNGELLKELGDGCLMIFSSAYDALKFSENLQDEINSNEGFKVRVGIHVGDVVKESNDYFGSGVNIASRIYNFANPGEICISQDVYSQIRSHKDILTKSLGNKDIKGIDDKIDIYKIINKNEDNNNQNISQDVSLLDEVIKRRVMQFFGVYAAVGWTIIQFIDWITIRYQYSPHLVDLALGVIISMIPSILILSYFHGAPGKDKWTKVEKIAVPLNVIVSIFALVVIFSPRDLGATTKKVSYEDENGNTIERIIPKIEFRKNIMLFNFKADDAMKEKWLSYGLPGTIEYKLMHDIYMNTSIQINFDDELDDYNKEIIDIIPLSLQREIAKKEGDQFFLGGEISFSENMYVVKTKLYSTAGGKLIKENTYKNKNFFLLVDEISFDIRQNLGLPQQHLEESPDLPVSEIFSESKETIKYLMDGMIDESEGNIDSYINLFEKSIESDETCAICYLKLQNAYVMNNQGDKRVEVIKEMQKYDYKLPERFRFLGPIITYFETGEAEKCITVAEMQIKLYPDILLGYHVLAEFYTMKKEHHKVIDQYNNIVSIYEGKLDENYDIAKYLIMISKVYIYNLNDYVKAKSYIERFLEYYPEESYAYELLGNILSYEGMPEKSVEMYDIALTLDPSNIGLMCDIAWNKSSDALERINDINQVLSKCTEISDSAEVYIKLSTLNREYGRIREAIKYNSKAIELKSKYQSFMYYFGRSYYNATSYARIGKIDEGLKVINDLELNLQKPFSNFSEIFHLWYYVASEQWNTIEEMLPKCREISAMYGVEAESIDAAQGFVYENLYNDYEKAANSFAKSIEANPGNRYADQYIDQARCYRKNKNYKKALDILNFVQSSELLYKWDADLEFAYIYKNKNNYSKALKHLNDYLEHYKYADKDYNNYSKAISLKEELSKLN